MRVMEVMGQTERSDTEDWKDKGKESVSEGLICLWRTEEFGRSSFFFFYFLSAIYLAVLPRGNVLFLSCLT